MDNKEEISKLNDEYLKAAFEFSKFVRENPGKDYSNYSNNLFNLAAKISPLVSSVADTITSSNNTTVLN